MMGRNVVLLRAPLLEDLGLNILGSVPSDVTCKSGSMAAYICHDSKLRNGKPDTVSLPRCPLANGKRLERFNDILRGRGGWPI